MNFPEFYRYVAKYMGKKQKDVKATLVAVRECLMQILSEKRTVKIFEGCYFVPRTVEKHEYRTPTGEVGTIDTYTTYSVYLTDWFRKQIRIRQGVTDKIVNIDGKWYKTKDLRKEEDLRIKEEREQELMPEWYGEKGWDTEVPDIE